LRRGDHGILPRDPQVVALLSSLTGLRDCYCTLSPALKGWAIFKMKIANWLGSDAALRRPSGITFARRIPVTDGAARRPYQSAVTIKSSEIAQRFNAGSRSDNSAESRQGRQKRAACSAHVSSLARLRHFDETVFPALTRWAIFRRLIASRLGRDAALRRPIPLKSQHRIRNGRRSSPRRVRPMANAPFLPLPTRT
jgi:hypothetical protein